MSITGTPDGPPVRLGVAIADIAAGMFAFQGMLLALIARARTGRGQRVDVSLLDSRRGAAHLSGRASTSRRRHPSRTGNRHVSIAPYDTFDTADGSLVLAVGNDAQWREFCDVLGARALAADPRFATNADRVRALRRTCARSCSIGSRADSLDGESSCCATPACRAARCDRSPRRWPIRRSSRGRWSRRRSSDDRPASGARTARSSCPTHLGHSAAAGGWANIARVEF